MCESRFPLKSQRGGAVLHYLTSTPSILAPSQGLMFYCHAALAAAPFNVAGRWGSVQHNQKYQKERDAACPVTYGLFGISFFPPPRSSRHTQRTGCSRLHRLPLKAPPVYLNLLSGLLEGGMWCVFVLLESPAGNLTPLSSCAAVQLIGAVFVFSIQVSLSIAVFAPEFYEKKKKKVPSRAAALSISIRS